MRVLLLSTSFPSKAYPVSGIFIQRMVQQLPEGIRVTVITPGSDQPEPSSRSNRIKTVRFRYAPQAWQTLAHKPGGLPAAIQNRRLAWCLMPFLLKAMSLATWIHAGKTDLIHANWSVCGIVAGLIGKIRNKPVITTLRGSDMLWAGKSPAFRQTVRWSCLLSSRLVTQSQAMADRLGRWFPQVRRKIVVIPNGVNGQPATATSQNGKRFTISVFGNLVPLKRVDDVVRAFSLLMSMSHKVEMRIVGDGPERKSLQRLVQDLGLENQVAFTGQVAPDNIPGQLAECSVLVLASSSEGRPNVILEAMAAGVPVIASDIEGVREMMGNDERGLLFAAGNVSNLAGCLGRLITEPSLGAQLASNAGQWLHDQELTWGRTAFRYADIYRQVILEHRQGV